MPTQLREIRFAFVHAFKGRFVSTARSLFSPRIVFFHSRADKETNFNPIKMKKTLSYLLLCVLAFGAIRTSSAQDIATFEDLELEPESWWNGSDTNGINEFGSGAFRFVNNYNKEYSSWNGFAYSKVSSSQYEPSIGLDNQYRSAAGGGANGSQTFGLCFYSSYNGPSIIAPQDKEKPCEIKGVYLTNIATTYQAILHGDDYVVPFDSGDFYKIVFTGRLKGDSVSQMDIYLADYRDADSNNHYCLNTWEWFDLSPLGTVDTVWVSTLSSQIGQWGDNLASYFAIDDLGSSAPVDTLPSFVEIGIGEDTSFSFDFLFELPGKGQYFASISDSTDSTIAAVSLTDSLLTVSAKTEGETGFTVKGIRNGRIAYTRVEIKVVKTEETAIALQGKQSADVRLYPVPARDLLNIATDIQNYDVDIINLSGHCVKKYRALNGQTQLNISDLPAGMYLLRLKDGNILKVSRFVVGR